MDLPAGWIILGSPGYEAVVDAGPAMADWLERLDLTGQHAFRAYEPRPSLGGLRLAINPVSPWSPANPGIFDAQANIEALPGVRPGSVTSVWVATHAGKGFGYQWVQALDWGDGAVSERTCIGWSIYTEFNPVDVVFSYPAGMSRTAEIEALMTTFRVTDSAVWSVPPGVTMPPSPTPFDKSGTPGPVATYHAVPDLEALLPTAFEGRVLAKQSRTGVDAAMPSTDPILAAFGKQPSEYQYAEAYPQSPPVLIIGVTRLRGVLADALLAAQLSRMPSVKATVITLAGRPVTATVGGMFPVWYWATGDLLYGIVATDEATAAKALGLFR